MNFQKTVILCAALPSLMALIVGLRNFHRLNKSQKALLALVGFIVSIEIASRVMWFLKVNNLFLLPFYTVVEFSFLLWVFRTQLHQKKEQRILLFFFLGFLLFSLIYLVFVHDFSLHNNYHRIVESVFLLFLALWYYFRSIKSLKDRFLEYNPMFWIATGILIYFSGTVFIFLLSNYLRNYTDTLRLNVWAIHALFNVILYTLYGIALWIDPKKQNFSS